LSWKQESIDRLFNPESIAVVGASPRPESLGALTFTALDKYRGKKYPVNPGHDSIDDMQCYASVLDIPYNVDLAILALGAPHVLGVMKECAEKGVKSAIIFAAGFKELGGKGTELQKNLKKVANNGKIAVIGPNCLGAGNVRKDMNATFFPHPAPLDKGSVSVISQSGGVSGLMLYRASESGVGISKFASVGNRVNVDFNDLLCYFNDDSETEVICMFVEGTGDARLMYEETKKITPNKDVVVYKVGKTPASKKAALSHTGSLAGNAMLYSAALKQARAIEVGSIQEMMDSAKVLSAHKIKAEGKRVAVITHSLGIALIAAQTLEQHGMHLPEPSKKTVTAVRNLLDMPVEIPVSNPVDLLAKGWAEPDVFAKAFEIVLDDDAFDAILTVFSPNFQEGIGGGMPAEAVVEAKKNGNKPVISVLNAPHSRIPQGKKILEAGGIPTFASPERAAIALSTLLVGRST